MFHACCATTASATTPNPPRRLAVAALRRRDSGEHVDPVEMAVQQQHLDEHPRARGITVGFAWIVPLMKAYPNKMVKYTHDWVYFDAYTAEMVFWRRE
jgi:hypothetical protein